MTAWHRVSHQHPCAICGKPDWCTYAGDTACCMRVASTRPARNGGWMHGGSETESLPHARPAMPPLDIPPMPTFDASLWHATCQHIVAWDRIETWAVALGLPVGAMDVLGAVTLGSMLAFPMRDGDGAICGIRTRYQDGSKKAVTGSRAGVFVPVMPPDADAVVCEGPTDAAAAYALGFWPIGRPSCQGSEAHVVGTCRRHGIAKVTVCADADGPGIAGARKLIDVLHAARIGTRMVTPGGHKDLRDWFKAGATQAAVCAQWSQAEWRS